MMLVLFSVIVSTSSHWMHIHFLLHYLYYLPGTCTHLLSTINLSSCGHGCCCSDSYTIFVSFQSLHCLWNTGGSLFDSSFCTREFFKKIYKIIIPYLQLCVLAVGACFGHFNSLYFPIHWQKNRPTDTKYVQPDIIMFQCFPVKCSIPLHIAPRTNWHE